MYLVARNEEMQYALWSSERELPAGWTAEGTWGGEHECLRHIEAVWSDMRPRSVRGGAGRW